MSLQLQSRDVAINGGQPTSYQVVADDSGTCITPSMCSWPSGPTSRRSDDQRRQTASPGPDEYVRRQGAGDRLPGSPSMTPGDRVQNITDADNKGNQLNLLRRS